jgi:hypothetical protein
MLAPERFAEWVTGHVHEDKLGRRYCYHSRSDAHSVALCGFVWEDLLASCPVLRSQAESGDVVCGINVSFTWATSAKTKTLDLAIGPPESPTQGAGLGPVRKAKLREVFLSCEAKSVMTEHGKSQPRVFDELSSSHEIVHHGDQRALARQREGKDTYVSPHKQPGVAGRMIEHLRGLPIRDEVGQVGFDAYATIVVSCTNQVGDEVRVWTEPPAPQPGDADHYETFLKRISDFYSVRFG